jgi:hypothetical protein
MVWLVAKLLAEINFDEHNAQYLLGEVFGGKE